MRPYEIAKSNLQSFYIKWSSHLMLNSDLDSDHNYYHAIINYIDTCDYHDEDSFKLMAKGSAYTDFSSLHLNIRSILSKFDDFKAYL